MSSGTAFSEGTFLMIVTRHASRSWLDRGKARVQTAAERIRDSEVIAGCSDRYQNDIYVLSRGMNAGFEKEIAMTAVLLHNRVSTTASIPRAVVTFDQAGSQI